MKPVLRLVEDPAPRAVYDAGRNLLAAVGGEAVEEDGVVHGQGHQLFVNPVGGESLLSLLCFFFLAHARPHIGVEDARADRRLARVPGQGGGGA